MHSLWGPSKSRSSDSAPSETRSLEDFKRESQGSQWLRLAKQNSKDSLYSNRNSIFPGGTLGPGFEFNPELDFWQNLHKTGSRPEENLCFHKQAFERELERAPRFKQARKGRTVSVKRKRSLRVEPREQNPKPEKRKKHFFKKSAKSRALASVEKRSKKRPKRAKGKNLESGLPSVTRNELLVDQINFINKKMFSDGSFRKEVCDLFNLGFE